MDGATLREAVIAALLLVGAGFALVGSIGLARLPDFYARLHGPTKATTLGVGATLAASALWFSGRDTGVSLHELLVTGFLFLTAPASAHLLARAALHLGVRERSRWLAPWPRRPAAPGTEHPLEHPAHAPEDGPEDGPTRRPPDGAERRPPDGA